MHFFFNGVLAFVIFVLPVGIYCLVLSAINRRGTPLLVRGFWDTAGALFAASGFLLGTAPMLLTVFYLNSVLGEANLSFEAIAWRHVLIWLIYFLSVITGAAFLLVWRSHKTMIYNIDPEMFPHLFDAALAPLGLAAASHGRRLAIAPVPAAARSETAVMAGSPVSAISPLPSGERRSALNRSGDDCLAELEVEEFPFFCHVTMHWYRCTPRFRLEFEKALERQLQNAQSPENPAAGWFLSASALILGMSFTILAMILFLVR